MLSLKTPKKLFDALMKLFEGKNINQKMKLRNQLKNVNIWNSETMMSYFTRVIQYREKNEAVEEEEYIGVTSLNGLPISWDSFIQGICAKRKLITFGRL